MERSRARAHLEACASRRRHRQCARARRSTCCRAYLYCGDTNLRATATQMSASTAQRHTGCISSRSLTATSPQLVGADGPGHGRQILSRQTALTAKPRSTSSIALRVGARSGIAPFNAHGGDARTAPACARPRPPTASWSLGAARRFDGLSIAWAVANAAWLRPGAVSHSHFWLRAVVKFSRRGAKGRWPPYLSGRRDQTARSVAL